MAYGDISQTTAAAIAAAQRNYQQRVAAANANNAMRLSTGGNGMMLGAGGNINPSQVLAQQAGAVNNLSYTPIDIDAIKQQATQQAAQNAAESVALEQKFSPGVATVRTGLQKQVADELGRGGNLPPDVAARIGRMSGAQAGMAGVLGSQAPATAAALGLTSLDLANQRRANAANLLAANPMPVAGLNPGEIASLGLANNQQANQFALSKLGAQANLANTQLGFLGAQQADQRAQQSINAAQNPALTLSAMPYIPLSPQSGDGAMLDLRGNPIGTSSYGQQLYQNESLDAQLARNRQNYSERAAQQNKKTDTIPYLSVKDAYLPYAKSLSDLPYAKSPSLLPVPKSLSDLPYAKSPSLLPVPNALNFNTSS